jgi:glycosidase
MRIAGLAIPALLSSLASGCSAHGTENDAHAIGGDGGEPPTDAATIAPPDAGVSADSGETTDSGETLPSDAGMKAAPDGADAGPDAGKIAPIDLSSATIYSVYTPIFSSAGNLGAVTAQLGRLHALGFNVVYLLPVTPIGQPVNGHPSYGSPYCVHDYYAIDPALGTASDLVTLVKTAHGLGMHVVLDEVLNHTAWDNELITLHPEYYVHSDGNPTNVNSIAQALSFPDVAQLDYKSSNGLAAYITTMLEYWIMTYDVDGFRFDTADAPYGSGRMIPSSFWVPLRAQLEAAKPGFVMLGEEEDPALALAPFDLDYNWHLQGLYGSGGLQQVATGGSATLLQQAWAYDQNGSPTGMKHMTLLQDWDLGEDLQMYGGAANTMAAATFNFTLDGVPLLFNGEEVGNDLSGVNTHNAIDWNSPNAATFTSFYRSLLALRNGSTALQQGAVTWVTSSAPAQIASYTRRDASGAFLVLVNFSAQTVHGTVAAPPASGWTDVSPVGSPGAAAHVAPPSMSLKPYDFAVFQAK